MSYIISIIICLICAYGCYVLAGKCGYNKILGAVLGFFFSIIALVVYFVLSLIKK